jgi:DNA-directed RNA polymerase specialized sigma24 family protein
VKTAPDLFLTTRWTLVLAAGRPNSAHATQALEELCRAYWYPLYAYVRRQGHSKEDSEDLVQGFFSRFLDKNYLATLSRDKGKFRAFLLASLKHYLANEWDRAHRLKRGGHLTILPLDWADAETRYGIDPADQLTPDKLYDRAWAVTVLERVLIRLRQETAAEGKSALFEAAKSFLSLGKDAGPYSLTAASLGMSESALRVAVHRLRRRYRELLRDEIAHTLSDPRQLEEEFRSLLQAVSQD